MVHIFKITALTVLCLFNTGMLAQDQQSHIKQLDYDIMTWKARVNVTDDIKMWALKGTIGFTLAAFAIGGFRGWAHRGLNYWGYGMIDLASSALHFGSKCCGCALFLDLCASKYATGIVRELEKYKERLTRNQQTA